MIQQFEENLYRALIICINKYNENQMKKYEDMIGIHNVHITDTQG